MPRKKREKRASAKSMYLQGPNLWVVLSVVFLVSTLTLIIVFGPSPLTGNMVQNIGYMTKGEPLHVSINDVPYLDLLYTNAAETIKGGAIVVEVDDSIIFGRSYLTKFNVTSVGKFGSMQFTFKVKEQDLYSKGIGQYDLRLYQGSKEYPLQLLKYTYGYFYYVVTVPEMGKFVLGRVAPPEEPEPVAEVVPNVSAAEEEPAVPAVTVPEEEALIGKAVELPPQEEKGLWTRIADFFRNLFG